MNDNKINVLEYFYSIDGETKRSGELAWFIRLSGCNLACSYCFGPNRSGKYPFVTLPDLSKKPINELKIGDTILTLDENKNIVQTEVSNIKTREVNEYNCLSFSNTSFIVTPEHPFRVADTWKEVRDLKPGDICINATNEHYAKYLLYQYKDDLYNYTKTTLDLILQYERYRKGNSGSRNGNYNPNKYNYLRLKDAIKKGIAKIDIITGEICNSLVVHHLDENKNNDSIDNLVIISSHLHNQLHTRGKSFWSKSNTVFPLKGIPVVKNSNTLNSKMLRSQGTKQVVGISCYPYNTYLINDILVHNCDTNYCHYDKGDEWDPTILVKKIMETNKCRKVTLTGGEPLNHPNVSDLIKELLVNGFDVNIETNGSINPYKVLDKTTFGKYRRNGQLWFSMDYKSKFSKMQRFMLSARSMAYILGDNDCLKFVVANEEDLNDAYHRIKLCERYYRERKVPEFKRCTYYLSPCFGEIELPKIIDFMKDKELIKRVKFQVQVHKIVWPAEKRGV